MRIATGDCDRTVLLWIYNEAGKKFNPELITTHEDWVRDVAFANNIGLPYEIVASCSEDRTVSICKRIDNKWTETKLPKFRVPVWRVSWSLAGNLLAVACADNIVFVYEEKTVDKWEAVAEMNQNSASKSE